MPYDVNWKHGIYWVYICAQTTYHSHCTPHTTCHSHWIIPHTPLITPMNHTPLSLPLNHTPHTTSSLKCIIPHLSLPLNHTPHTTSSLQWIIPHLSLPLNHTTHTTCHSHWIIPHTPLVSISLCLVLPSPSPSSCTWSSHPHLFHNVSFQGVPGLSQSSSLAMQCRL